MKHLDRDIEHVEHGCVRRHLWFKRFLHGSVGGFPRCSIVKPGPLMVHRGTRSKRAQAKRSAAAGPPIQPRAVPPWLRNQGRSAVTPSAAPPWRKGAGAASSAAGVEVVDISRAECDQTLDRAREAVGRVKKEEPNTKEEPSALSQEDDEYSYYSDDGACSDGGSATSVAESDGPDAVRVGFGKKPDRSVRQARSRVRAGREGARPRRSRSPIGRHERSR